MRKVKQHSAAKMQLSPKQRGTQQAKALHTQSLPSHQPDLAIRQINRVGSTPPNNLVVMLKRSSTPQNRQILLQLQQQYGNRYVQRVLELSRRGGEVEVAPEIEADIDQARGSGQPLDKNVQAQMESAFNVDFSHVRVHTDRRADTLNQALNASAFTTETNIFFRQGEYNPASFSGRKLLAHELTHVVQQTIAPSKTQMTPVLQRAGPATRLGAIPDVERRQMQSSTIPVPSTLAGQLIGLFATNPSLAGGATTSYPVSATVSFSASIPATGSVAGFDLHRGLTSVAGWLMGQTTPTVLSLNTTVSLQLDLTPFGGDHAIYRFSYYDVGRGTSPAEHLLIENVANAPAAPTRQQLPTGSTFQVGGHNFRIGSGWSQAEFTLLHQALSLLPSSALQQIENVEFQRAPVQSGDPEAGHYDPNTNTVTIRDNAFNTSLSRFGSSPDSIRIIAHEIGHALDYAILNRAWSQYSSSGNAPRLLGARSLSGLVYQQDASSNFTIVEGARNTDYRRAVERDRSRAGGRTMPTSITTYGDTNWEENFAEAYSLFLTDPATFRELRPNTYAYFTQQFP